MNRLKIALTIAPFLLSSLALAEAPAKKTAPAKKPERTPAPELKNLAFLAGSWSCEGKSDSGDPASAILFKSTFQLRPELKNFWYALDYSQKGSQSEMNLKGFMGYTATNHQYVLASVNTMGGEVHLVSSGWEGDKLAFTGTAVGIASVPTRYTYMKQGEKELEATLESQDEKSEWVKIFVEHCKKTK